MQKRKTRGRKQKTFGKLPVSNLAGNAESYMRDTIPRLIETVRRLRKEKGQHPESCQGVW